MKPDYPFEFKHFYIMLCGTIYRKTKNVPPPPRFWERLQKKIPAVFDDAYENK